MADPYGALRDVSALDALLGGLMVAVVLYCLARAFVPALRPDGHRRDLDAWHLVMAAAMAVMLVPAATLAPATAATSAAAGQDQGMQGMHGMHHDHAAAASGAGPLALPSLLVVLLLALVAVLVVTRLTDVVRRGAPAAGRLDAGCEVLMGVAMAAMLAPLV